MRHASQRIPFAILGIVFVIYVNGLPFASAQQSLTILGYEELTGTIRSVAPGTITVADADGKERQCKIQAADERGISLAGAEALLNFPAEVDVSGRLERGTLRRGSPVRFAAKLNRLGRTEGKLAELVVVDEDRYEMGIEVNEAPEKPGDFGSCTITGQVYSLRDDHLVVTVPAGDYVRKTRLAFKLAEDAAVRLESRDYRRANAGDKVTRLVVAKLNTGDLLVKELAVVVAADSAAEPAVGGDAGGYLQLSDEPAAPRDLRSAHFLLHTDLSDRNARILLDKLETMIALVSQYYGRLPGGLIEAYVVRDLSQWPRDRFPPEAVAKIAEPAGVTLSVSLGRLTRSVVYACDRHGVVQHEVIHAYCSQTFGSTGPTWYAEGMAEMGQYWRKDMLAIEVNPIVIDYLKNAPPKKMLDIVAAGQITGDSWRAYAWRWALCHLLAFNPNYMGRFKGLGIALMSEHPGASFENTYGPVAREISFEYDFFVRHMDNGYRVDLCAWPWNRKFQYIRGQGHVSTKVQAVYGWQASGFKLQAGQSYDFAAQGTWQVQQDAEPVDADGDQRGRGRVVGVLMKDYVLSDPIELGTRGSFVAPTDGDLYLRCRDDWNHIADNEGEMTIFLRKSSAD